MSNPKTDPAGKPAAPDVAITSIMFATKVNIGGERTDWWNDKRNDGLGSWRPQASPMGMEFHQLEAGQPTGRVSTVPWAQILVWDRGPKLATVPGGVAA